MQEQMCSVSIDIPTKISFLLAVKLKDRQLVAQPKMPKSHESSDERVDQ